MTQVGGTAKSSKDPVEAPVPGRLECSAPPEDLCLLDALRRGEETAFLELVSSYQSSLVRLASQYVPTRAVAEEVVQETWLGVLQGINGFEARSSLKTWIFRILVNRARTWARREGRMVPFSSLVKTEIEAQEVAVEPGRFLGEGDDLPGHWASPPTSWGENPEERLLSRETLDHIRKAIEALPRAQQIVITLRDVYGWTCEEICNVLEISEPYQRVLLHRARSKVRTALERYLEKD